MSPREVKALRATEKGPATIAKELKDGTVVRLPGARLRRED